MSDDPLRALDAQIKRAQELDAPVAVAQVSGADALERLRALMARGRGERAAALPPSLAALIAQARDLSAAPAGQPTSASSQPINALSTMMAAERAALGARKEPLAARTARAASPAPSPAPASAPQAPPGAPSDAIGRELLGALGAQPLSGATRAAVARALAEAMEAPSAEALRAILRMVIHDAR